VYRSELAARLTVLGYELEGKASDQPETRGCTTEHLRPSSLHRQQIEANLAVSLRDHCASDGEAKLDITPEELQRQVRALTALRGSAGTRVCGQLKERAQISRPTHRNVTAYAAVTSAKQRDLPAVTHPGRATRVEQIFAGSSAGSSAAKGEDTAKHSLR
jgi:hypothetical protein